MLCCGPARGRQLRSSQSAEQDTRRVETISRAKTGQPQVSDQGSTRAGAAAVMRAIRRRLPVVLACLVIVPAVAVGISLRQDKEYEATTSLLFRQPKIDEVVADGTIFADIGDPNRFAVTNLQLIGLDAVARRTAARLGLTRRKVAASITILPEGESDVAAVTATASSPSGAARLANAYADTYIRMREDADHSLIRQNIALLRREFDQLPAAQRTTPAGDIIQDRINRLKLLDGVKLGGVQVVDAATPPSSPAAPKPARNGLIGLALAALLGLGLALVLERLDRRLRRPEDVEAAFDLPILAHVPASDALLPEATNGAPLDDGDAEALKGLRTKVRHSGPRENVSSVLVASAARAEGRTTIAWDLAAISAGLGLSVLLLEADLQNPRLAEALDMPGARGLAQVLAGDVAFEQPLQRSDARVLARFGNGGGTVDVLVAGSPSGDSIDLIDGKRMRDLLPRLQERYDLVVIDSPAASDAKDFLPLAKMVAAVIVVARPGVLPREAARALSKQLREIGVRPLGVVLNCVAPPKDVRRAEPAPDLVAAQ
jgi:succinoglycan biosynthesis transport protein ExoP